MIQYYSTKQYFHFDCIVLLYVLYNTLMLVVKNEHIICPYMIYMIHVSPYYIVHFQLPKVSGLQ